MFGLRLALRSGLLALAASPALAAPPCTPIALELEIPGLEEGERAGKATIEVVSTLPAPGATVTLLLPQGMGADRTEWTVELTPGVPLVLSARWWLVGGPGNYTITANASRVSGPQLCWASS